jgi:surfactin synthase thioesterase subunit
MNGTPPEVFVNQELLDTVLPTLRADFELYETYVYTHETPLPCPITVFGGAADPLVPVVDLAAWSVHTTLGCRMTRLPGDHFFLHTARETLLEHLRETIRDDWGV